MSTIWFVLAAWIVGSVPFGILVGKFIKAGQREWP